MFVSVQNSVQIETATAKKQSLVFFFCSSLVCVCVCAQKKTKERPTGEERRGEERWEEGRKEGREDIVHVYIMVRFLLNNGSRRGSFLRRIWHPSPSPSPSPPSQSPPQTQTPASPSSTAAATPVASSIPRVRCPSLHDFKCDWFDVSSGT